MTARPYDGKLAVVTGGSRGVSNLRSSMNVIQLNHEIVSQV